jgi:ABC-type nickel/cobalt efflux system permease component RcnA
MGALLSMLVVPWTPPLGPGDSVLITVRHWCGGGMRVARLSRAVGSAQGCDTGFGHLLAQQLFHRGFCVYAACLTPDGISVLEGKLGGPSKRLHTFLLDVTKPADIAACADRVRTHSPGGLKYGAHTHTHTHIYVHAHKRAHTHKHKHTLVRAAHTRS